ncbi:MAG: hypothetical protein H6706_30510 [Myxococcales bacterium]|nr:hypothetical protein [Myxococcales bacterium]
MTWALVLGAVAAAVVVGLGHVRLLRRQQDVEAAARQIAILTTEQAALPPGPPRDAVAGRLAAVQRIYANDLARYQATPGARINRWRPPTLPPA